MEIGRLKAGATAHLKSTPYWIDEYDSIPTLDGLIGEIRHDYTHIEVYPHMGFIPFNIDTEIGIAPEFVVVLGELVRKGGGIT